MPKYVKTIVKKSILIPWITDTISVSNSSFLTAEQNQIREEAIAETGSFPGYLNYNSTKVGNTEIITYEFDTLENLTNYVNRTQNKQSEDYDETTKTAMYNKIISDKIKELDLTDSFQVSTSVDLN
jgi:hypothetical protein